MRKIENMSDVITVTRFERKDGSTGLDASFENVPVYWAFLDKPKTGEYQGKPTTPSYQVTMFLTDEQYDALEQLSPTYFEKVKVLDGDDWEKAKSFTEEDWAAARNKKYRPIKGYLESGKPIPDQHNQYMLVIGCPAVKKDGTETKKPDFLEYLGKDKVGEEIWKRLGKDEKGNPKLVGNGTIASIDCYGFVQTDPSPKVPDVDRLYLGKVFITELVEYVAPIQTTAPNKRGKIVDDDEVYEVSKEEVDEATEAIAPQPEKAASKPTTRRKTPF